MRKKFTSRVAAVIGVATLATVGVVGVASAATFPNTDAIDENEPASLTIHKFAGSPWGDDYDGSVINPDDIPADAKPLPGVQFTVCEFTELSPSDDDDWPLIEELNTFILANGTWEGSDVEGATDSGDCTNSSNRTTNSEGQAIWASPALGHGVYFVTETITPPGHNIVEQSWPFLVTLPLPTNEPGGGLNDSGWIYDVHAYPKNAVAAVEVSVTDIGHAGLGSVVPWTVSTTLPYLQFDGDPVTSPAQITQFSVVGTIGSDLDYVPGSVVVTVDGVALDPSAYTAIYDSGAVTVTIDDPSGIGARQTVDVTFGTTVTGLGTDGYLDNVSYQVFINNSEMVPTGTPPTSNWGAAQIFKHNVSNVGLSGATFQVFETPEAAQACITATATEDPCVDAIEVDDEDEFTTDDNGYVTIPGLNVGINTEGVERTYYLAEIVAPTGYFLLFDPIAVTVEPNNGTNLTEVPVLNVQKPPITLPNTGAQGTFLLLAGAGILGVGALALFASNKRKADKKG